MDARNVAIDILKYIGGSENVVSAAHCTTRLRLVIADHSLCKKEKIEKVKGVKSVFLTAGQLQIVFGTDVVKKVYEEFVKAGQTTDGKGGDLVHQLQVEQMVNVIEGFTYEGHTIYAPLCGKVIPFLAESVGGKGMAIDPLVGEVVAPFDGIVVSLSDTKHAIRLRSNDWMEVLIHVGRNTAKLDGRLFESFVKEGDHVKAGQPLVAFDLDKMVEGGCDVTTSIIVTNSNEYEQVECIASGVVKDLDKVMVVTEQGNSKIRMERWK